MSHTHEKRHHYDNISRPYLIINAVQSETFRRERERRYLMTCFARDDQHEELFTSIFSFVEKEI